MNTGRLEGKRPVSDKNAPSAAEIRQLTTLSEQTDLNAAEICARKITQRYPRHGFGWHALGTVLLLQGRHREALPALEKAVRLLPKDARVHCNLGLVLMNLGQLAEAETHYRKGLQLDPKLAEIHNNLGTILRAQGRLAEAESAFRQAIESKRDHLRAWQNLGLLLLDQGRLAESEQAFRQADAIAPQNAVTLRNLASVLERKNERLFGE